MKVVGRARARTSNRELCLLPVITVELIRNLHAAAAQLHAAAALAVKGRTYNAGYGGNAIDYI